MLPNHPPNPTNSIFQLASTLTPIAGKSVAYAATLPPPQPITQQANPTPSRAITTLPAPKPFHGGGEGSSQNRFPQARRAPRPAPPTQANPPRRSNPQKIEPQGFDAEEKKARFPIKLETQEEIAAWIAERKKNWPTAKNQEKKQKEEEERRARGELMPNPKKRKFGGAPGGGKPNRFEKRQKGKEDRAEPEKQKPVVEERREPLQQQQQQASRIQEQEEKKDEILKSKNALSALAYYSSDSDGEENPEDEAAHEKISPEQGQIQIAEQKGEAEEEQEEEGPEEEENRDEASLENQGPKASKERVIRKKPCRFFLQGKCREENCRFSHDVTPRKPRATPRVPLQHKVLGKRPPLLAKLLEKDIRERKNVMLQCLRFIVDSNFFL